MTRCKHCSYNNRLKSSAYNPTGESYEVQLTAYNAMTNHLRKVMLAKSVVDSGKVDNVVFNKHDIRRRAKTPDRKRNLNLVKGSLSQNLIDRLAYDTKHHPNEIANMSWGWNKRRSANYNSNERGNRSNSTDSSEDSSIRDHRVSVKKYGDKFRAVCCGQRSTTRSSPPSQRGTIKKHKCDLREKPDDDEESDEFEDTKKRGKSDHEHSRHALKTFHTVIPCVTSTSQISYPGTSEFVASLIASTSDINSDRFCNDSRMNTVNMNNDASMYIKFVYDITKEVMDRGYYSDNEIERVFAKHINRNLGRLNENKMLQEINCLKRALNMNYNFEDEEDVAYSFEKLQNQSFIKANKILEKQTVRNKQNPQNDDLNGRNIADSLKELIIDSRREIVVNKEDVLTTLLEMDLNLEKAKEICKSLQNRSKRMFSNQSSFGSKEEQLSTADEKEEELKRAGSQNIQPKASINTDFNVNCNCERMTPITEISTSFYPTSTSSIQKTILKSKSSGSGLNEESFVKVENDEPMNDSEKEEIKEINYNSDLKHTVEEFAETPKKNLIVSNQDLNKSDSPAGEISAVTDSGKGIINGNVTSDNVSNSRACNSDDTRVVSDLG